MARQFREKLQAREALESGRGAAAVTTALQRSLWHDGDGEELDEGPSDLCDSRGEDEEYIGKGSRQYAATPSSQLLDIDLYGGATLGRWALEPELLPMDSMRCML